MKANMVSVSNKPIDLFKDGITDGMSISSDITGNSSSILNTGWLPMAAKALNISPYLKDYICVPVVGLFTGIPNTNGDLISTSEMLKWNIAHGGPAYSLFKGKSMFVEHDNQDPVNKSRGIVFDSYLVPLKGFQGNHAKVVLLVGIDRTKDVELANSILSGENNKYSIGCRFDSYTCSITGQKFMDETGSRFTRPGVPTYQYTDGRLVFRSLHGEFGNNISGGTLLGFELSVVAKPAYCPAVSDILLK